MEEESWDLSQSPERGPMAWIAVGHKDVDNRNPYSAEVSYRLAGEEGHKHREELILNEAKKDPVRAFLLLNNDDSMVLWRKVQAKADEKRLNLLRDYMDKNFK